MRAKSTELLVIEYGGTARSGKGTIVNHFGETRANVATDETGSDYRALTKSLLIDGLIERGMPTQTITKQLARVSLNCLSDRVASRQSLVDSLGLSSLYDNDVNETVSVVSPIEAVRKAVKAGFKQRVEMVRDTGDHDVLVVDGRNLAPVIESIEGTKLLMRTFVSCTPEEAARRECARQGINPNSPEAQAIAESIRSRNENDANRATDPVRPDDDAIDYWLDPLLFADTVQDFADSHYDGNYDRAMTELLLNRRTSLHPVTRLGAGALAATCGRQISFDTSHFRAYDKPKETMILAADQMYEEALKAVRVTSRV
ncbi:MAG TPA: (d)CMP kinase [Candidatus Saccharimonadales bacterium]|nr:(d)CMP kinase [Candidatus Saccharimonadales bacterium]